MKNYLIILISFISLTFSFAQERILGQPIPGCDVKVGRKPPGGGQIIVTGKTNAKGEFEFKNLAPGTYFIEFAIKEQGVKNATQPVRSEDFILSHATGNAVNPTARAKQKGAEANVVRAASTTENPTPPQSAVTEENLKAQRKVKKIMTEQYGEIELVVTYQGDMIRGTIVLSRSNIKK